MQPPDPFVTPEMDARADASYLSGCGGSTGGGAAGPDDDLASPFRWELARLRRRERDLLEKKRLLEAERLEGPAVSAPPLFFPARVDGITKPAVRYRY